MSPKKKALVFAASLVLVSTLLVGSAVATTNSALQPFLRGEGFAKERSLTRGEFVSLALQVGQEQDGNVTGIPDALVQVFGPNATEVLAEKRTGPEGGVVFELKRGSYDLLINSSAGETTKHVGLGHSLRMAVVFDAEGNAHWESVEHKQLERRGEHKHLLVRVGEVRDGERPAPVEGATIKVYRLEGAQKGDLVDQGTTGPRGFAAFNLPRGGYLIQLESENASSEHRIRLQGNLAVGAVIDGEDVEWRVERPDSHDFQRPTSRPRGGGPKKTA